MGVARLEHLVADRGTLKDAKTDTEEHDADRFEDVLLHDTVEVADPLGLVEAAGDPCVDLVHQGG